MQVRDTGGWWRIVIDYGAKSAKFCLGEGERGAIPTSASNYFIASYLRYHFPKKVKQACGFWRRLKSDLRLQAERECGREFGVRGFSTETKTDALGA